MSRRNRNKFRDRQQREAVAPAMVNNALSGDSSMAAAHSSEYRIIRNDMIRLVILNGIMFVAVLAVYFTNRSSGYLERLFERLF